MPSEAMRAVENLVEIPLNGASTYVSQGRVAASFDQLRPVGASPAIRQLIIDLTLVFEHDAGAPVNLPEEFPFRALEQIQLKTPRGHTFVDLDEQAGWLLYCALWAMNGKKPQRHGGSGNISLTNGTTTTVRVALPIPFKVLGGIEEDDYNVALADLQKSQLVMVWAIAGAGGVFDSGANNERLTAASTVRVFADMIGRNDEEYRGGPRFSLRSWECPGVNERLPIAHERLVWLIEAPLHAAGITANRITDAERDNVKLIVDGEIIVDDVDVRFLSRQWNQIHARGASTEEELPNHETDTSPWVPLYFPRRRPYKLMHAPACMKNPQVRFSGTDTTPKLVFLTSTILDNEAALGQLRDAKLPADAIERLSTKSASKSDVGPDVRGSLPYAIKRRRRAG